MAISKSSKDDKVNIAQLPWEPDKCPDLFPLVRERGDKSSVPPSYEVFPELLLPKVCGKCLAGFGEINIAVSGLCNQSFGHKLVISHSERQERAVCA